MPMLTGAVAAVLGVDTHRDKHSVAVVEPTGGQLASIELAADAFGYRRMLAFARTHAPGRRAWAIEGTGSFGAGLSTYLLEQGEWVIEIDRPARPARRNGAKSDELDAVRAAREALSREHLAQPRQRGDREAMRVLLSTRAGTIRARTKAICQLKALIVSAPEQLRNQLRPAAPTNSLTAAPGCARCRDATSNTAAPCAPCGSAPGKPCSSKRRPPTWNRSWRNSSRQRPRSCSTCPGSASSAPRRSSCPGHTPVESAARAPSPPSPGSPRSRPAAGRSSATGSTAAATASSTEPCTPS